MPIYLGGPSQAASQWGQNAGQVGSQYRAQAIDLAIQAKQLELANVLRKRDGIMALVNWPANEKRRHEAQQKADAAAAGPKTFFGKLGPGGTGAITGGLGMGMGAIAGGMPGAMLGGILGGGIGTAAGAAAQAADPRGGPVTGVDPYAFPSALMYYQDFLSKQPRTHEREMPSGGGDVPVFHRQEPSNTDIGWAPGMGQAGTSGMPGSWLFPEDQNWLSGYRGVGPSPFNPGY